MATLIVMVGPPGSGKSTWVKQYLADHPKVKVVNTDDLRKKLLGNVSDNSKNAMIWEKAHNQIKEYLQSGQDVILDAVNTSERDRERLRNFLKDVNYRLYYKVMPLEDLDTLHKRIKADLESGKDRSNVPPDIIERNIAKFKADIDKINKRLILK